MASVRIGVDVGGTFTDVVALVDDRIVTAKVPSTKQQADGVLEGIESAGVAAADIASFAHGTTVATNALLERRGARTALITTESFRDVIEIGRQDRPSLYDLTLDRPPALVPRELRFTVAERMGPDGELAALDGESLHAAVEALREADVEAAAVCFLFSYLWPEHERAAAHALNKVQGVHVSVSSEILPEFREYERFSTTVAAAYLGPVLRSYLERLRDGARGAGLPAPDVMQSSGGVIGIEDAAANAAACVLSGPAAGAVGAGYVARLGGHADVLTFDMGGTSTDVAPITDGAPDATTEGVIGGVPVKLPMVDIHTVGAGGGSIAWVDDGGALRVGPRSAGALPGPACYGRGGGEATVTDANLVLGYLDPDASLGGSIALDFEAALQAVARLGRRLGQDDPRELASGIVRVVNAEMTRALRVVSVERGLDPRAFALVAFGGAGPLHACALADELAMTTVLVPLASGVLSALGLAISDQRRDYSHPLRGALRDASDDMRSAFATLDRRAEQDLGRARRARSADLRYRGQSFELTVPGDEPKALEDAFHEVHERRYGYRMPDEVVEIVSVRMTATIPGPQPDLTEPVASRDRDTRRREAFLEGGTHALDIIARDSLGAGSRIAGPCIVELAESTALVAPGWSGAVDEAGNLVLTRTAASGEGER